MVKITKELQEHLINTENIPNVYFDANGRHYYNVFELQDKKDSKDKFLYGSGLYSHHRVIPGHNPDKLQEPVAIGDPQTKITDTLTREQVLAVEVKPEGESLVAKIANMSPEELDAVKSLLSKKEAPASPAPAPVAPKAK